MHTAEVYHKIKLFKAISLLQGLTLETSKQICNAMCAYCVKNEERQSSLSQKLAMIVVLRGN